MNINEKYILYHLAHQFVNTYEFKVLWMNEGSSEVWLTKSEHKKSRVIRLIHKGFDWKNHLKKDIATVFQRIRNFKRNLPYKDVEVINIYVTTHQPIDSWDDLKRPMKLKEKNPIWMHSYYLDELDYQNELERLQSDFHFKQMLVDDALTNEEKSERTNYYKQQLEFAEEQQRKQIENIFTYGKPILTYLFIAVNILIFFYLEMVGGSTNIETLVKYGAKYNPAIILDGEWWRLISSMFLHIGFLHLLMNMFALYFLGAIVERIFGSVRFFIIYFLSGLGGTLASFAVADSVAAGASGAIFGLFGALLFFGVHYKQLFFRTIGQGVLAIIIINLVIGLIIPEIDMAAHLGGLVTGFIASAICHLPQKKEKKYRLVAVATYAVIFVGFISYGLFNSERSQLFQLTKAEQMIMEQNYSEVIHAAEQGLKLDGDLDAYLLFQRAYAHLEIGELERAVADFEKSIAYEPIPEAYYNLAHIYEQQGDDAKAEEMIIQAYEMRPEEEQFQRSFERITGDSVD